MLEMIKMLKIMTHGNQCVPQRRSFINIDGFVFNYNRWIGSGSLMLSNTMYSYVFKFTFHQVGKQLTAFLLPGSVGLPQRTQVVNPN